LPSDLGPTGQQDPYQGYGVLYDAALCAFAFLFVVGVVHPRLSRDFMFRLAALPSPCRGSKNSHNIVIRFWKQQLQHIAR